MTTIDMSLRYLLLNQLRAIRSAGYRVSGMSAPGPDVVALREARIPHLPVALNRRVFTPLQDLRATWQMVRWFRRERPTIVHTHNPKPGFWGQIAARLAGVPYVVNTLHGFYFHEGTRPALRRSLVLLEKLAGRCSDLILSQNPEDVTTAITEGIAPPERIRYLGNGIDLGRFDPKHRARSRAVLRESLGIPADATVVGFVGRLVKEKGLLDLLDAAKRILRRNERFHLLIVGDTDEHKTDAFRPNDISDEGLRKAAHFVGQRDDMPEMYAAMDVFCLPSHREGFPRSPMEAAAMGLPCVVSDIRGCRQVVEHERTGLLFPVRDVAVLAKALERLVGDRSLRGRFGESGRALAVRCFDERVVFERVLAAYRDLRSTA